MMTSSVLHLDGRGGFGRFPALLSVVGVALLVACSSDGEGAENESTRPAGPVSGTAERGSSATSAATAGQSVHTQVPATIPFVTVIDVTLPTPSGVPHTTGGTPESPHPLEGALLTLEDVGDGWQSDGPEVEEVSPPPDDGVPLCPDGFPLPTPRLVVSVQFETVPSSEQFVVHELLQFGSEDDVVRFNLALESCLGRQWVEEGDPDEHIISFEPIELAQDHDEAYGFRQETEHGHADWLVFVPLGDTLLLLTMPQADVAEQFDEAMLDQLLTKAVARAESVIDE